MQKRYPNQEMYNHNRETQETSKSSSNILPREHNSTRAKPKVTEICKTLCDSFSFLVKMISNPQRRYKLSDTFGPGLREEHQQRGKGQQKKGEISNRGRKGNKNSARKLRF